MFHPSFGDNARRHVSSILRCFRARPARTTSPCSAKSSSRQGALRAQLGCPIILADVAGVNAPRRGARSVDRRAPVRCLIVFGHAVSTHRARATLGTRPNVQFVRKAGQTVGPAARGDAVANGARRRRTRRRKRWDSAVKERRRWRRDDARGDLAGSGSGGVVAARRHRRVEGERTGRSHERRATACYERSGLVRVDSSGLDVRLRDRDGRARWLVREGRRELGGDAGVAGGG